MVWKPTPAGGKPSGAAGSKTPYSAVAMAAAMMTMGPELAAWAGPLVPNMVTPSAYSAPVSLGGGCNSPTCSACISCRTPFRVRSAHA